jgi:16S rRNA G527 N7-methylase RsmG
VSELPAWLFAEALPGLRRPMTVAEGTSLSKYLILLRKWQAIVRLVGSTGTKWIVDNVLLDSLAFLELFPTHARTAVDIGSGAGIPGVPIAIVRPDLRLTLIEARRKRASFLATVVRELGLTNARVVHGRVEDLAADEGRGAEMERRDTEIERPATEVEDPDAEVEDAGADVDGAGAEVDRRSERGGRFDVAIARCVASERAIVPLALAVVRPGGLLITSAGPSAEPGSVVIEIRRGQPRHFRVHRKP